MIQPTVSSTEGQHLSNKQKSNDSQHNGKTRSVSCDAHRPETNEVLERCESDKDAVDESVDQEQEEEFVV